MLYVVSSQQPSLSLFSLITHHPAPFTVQSRKSQSYEPLLLENEREAVADLLQYLESKGPRSLVSACLVAYSAFHP